MSIRLSEEEAKQLGFRPDGKGGWVHARERTNSQKVRTGNLRPMPVVERPSERPVERQISANEADEESSEGRFRRVKGVRYPIVITAYRHRAMDPDNLCCKWFVDEFVRQKIIPGDSSKYIESVIKKIEVIPKDEPERVKVEIWMRMYVEE